ncbi:hypothetical protein [Winogradskyella endarachnes]|uniref:Glycosyltransferase RgtA/B/C/D-like domain-containing protein n=1 Tax=Winogradskyella endarachnes TaxID=2681965 RepID=A0A6L6UDP6_9FLAO|nr:hypothetical protein [Winogradskyella endarachnes]MUU79656.1 hypothetical protein [Winogradskyella endarachnes]
MAGIVGGLWYQLYSDGGILWFRLLAIIVNTSTFYMSYKLLKPFVKIRFLLLSLVMVVFVNDFGYLTFYHNQLTAFMSVLIIFTLYKAVFKNNLFLFSLAGFLLSINVFTRIPNLVLFSLIIIIPYAYYLRKENVKKSIKPLAFIAIGAVLGFSVVYITLWSLNQIEIMKNALLTIVDLGQTENSSHNFVSVFKAPYFNYRSIALELAKFVLIIGFLYVFNRFKPNYKIISALIFAVAVFLFIFWFNTQNIYPIYGLCLVGSCATLIINKVKFELKIIGLLSFITLITISLGTGGGIKNSGYMGIWVGLPLFFYLVSSLDEFLPNTKLSKIWLQLNIPKGLTQNFLLALSIAFLLLKTYNISQQSYFDEGSRFEKTYAIHSPLAKGIYTTERRAVIINELLLNLNKFVKPNDYLMIYDKIPMVHFLTETKPYMYNPWVWIYDYNSFEKKLLKAEREIPNLPIVLQQKFDTFYNFSEPIFEYMSTEKLNSNSHSNERNLVMNSFLNRNKYKIIWSNRYFNVYQSTNNSNKNH